MPASGAPTRSYGGEPLEARRRDQRERLLTGAREAFASQGYAGTSIEDVVGRARVSRTAFYRFFANKEECMLAVFEQGTGRTLEALKEVAATDLGPAAMIAAGVRVFFETLAHDPAMATVILIEAVGVSPAVEEARHAARMEFTGVIEKQLRASGVWKGHRTEELRLVSMATMAALAEAVEYLVATESFDRREAMVGVLTRYAQRALTPPG